MSVSGEVERVRFPLRLGDRTLAALRVPLLVVKSDFLAGGVDREQALAESDQAPEAHGVLFRSVPISAQETRFGMQGAAIRYVPSRFRRYYTPIEGTFEDYQARFSGKTRSGLRRKVRKFAESFGGDMEFRVYDDGPGMPEFHRFAREVSASTYQERLFDEGLPEGDAFGAEMVAAADAGRAVGFLLLGGGRPVAYIYCPLEGRRILYRYVGYDAAHARLSPGTVLQWLAFEYLFEHRPGCVFDFTEGEGEHKAFFGTDSIECANVYYLRPSLRGWLALVAHAASEAFNSIAGELLERLRLKRIVKSLIRRGTAPDGS